MQPSRNVTLINRSHTRHESGASTTTTGAMHISVTHHGFPIGCGSISLWLSTPVSIAYM